jgi:hypothetical protein
MATRRERQVLEALHQLAEQSQRLVKEHQEIMRDYDKLKKELECIRHEHQRRRITRRRTVETGELAAAFLD